MKAEGGSISKQTNSLNSFLKKTLLHLSVPASGVIGSQLNWRRPALPIGIVLLLIRAAPRLLAIKCIYFVCLSHGSHGSIEVRQSAWWGQEAWLAGHTAVDQLPSTVWSRYKTRRRRCLRWTKWWISTWLGSRARGSDESSTWLFCFLWI